MMVSEPKAVTVRGLALDALAARIGATLAGAPVQLADPVLVTDVQQDSRKVQPGDLFVALSGARSDGARFVRQARVAGAVAVLTERELPVSAPQLVHRDPRWAMALAAAEVHGHPTKELCVVGITGTNGKTTTAQLVAHALRRAGRRVGVIGTLGYDFDGRREEGTHTSPEADALQRAARHMLDVGVEVLVMEVSSIALAADRVAATNFDVGVFTNLTQDHLDYHGTMDAYVAAKDRLFDEHRPRRVVLNVDDEHGAQLARRVPGAVTFSAEGATATVRARAAKQSARGMELSVAVGDREYAVISPLIGAHNASNVLTVIGIAHALEIPLAPVVEALADAPPVPGRLERCDAIGVDDIVAVVDYAHTPDALERALAALRPLTQPADGSGRLWCVFGCGGDRDADKRAPMGRAVAQGADVAIVTNDNPRSESPQGIADAILGGFGNPPPIVELDRAAAITRAVLGAKKGDVVLVAGKGHEPYQIIGEERTAFDDRVVVRAALKKRREA